MQADGNTKRILVWAVWPVRVLIACGIAIVLTFIPYRAMGGNQKLDEMNQQLTLVEREIAETSLDLTRRMRRVQALKTDTRAIENIARDELRMLYPHEKTLRLDIQGRQP